jgi:hypothetical protein
MHDVPAPSSRRALRYLAGLFLLATACSSSRTPTAALPEEHSTEASISAVALPLQKAGDLEACKNAILSLEPFHGRPELKTEPLSEPELKALSDWARLNEFDRPEVVRPELSATSLDPHYLAEALLLRDAGRSLALDQHSPLKRASLVFDWVCRQVYLQEPLLPPVPVWYILQRGSGSGLERAYVFLAFLRQIGLDGCLIGPAGAADQLSYHADPAVGKPTFATFWAVGARIGAEIYLFDPRSGRAYPGPKGQEVATLRQAQSDDALLGEWKALQPAPAALKSDDWKQAELSLALPLTGMAPRMTTLEKVLGEVGVKLAADPLAARARFEKEAPPAKPLRFWSPPDDPFTPTRVLGRFLPLEQDGLDRSPAGQRLFDLYQRDLVPSTLFPEFALDPEGDPMRRLRGYFHMNLLPPLELTNVPPRDRLRQLTNGSPRDRLLRGQWLEATKLLAQKREESQRVREYLSLDKDLQKGVEEWAAEAEKRFAAVNRAKRQNNPVDLQQAEGRLNEFFSPKDSGGGRGKGFELIDLAVAQIVHADSTYLLGLTFHERAERLQTQHDKQPTADSAKAVQSEWKNSRDWWQRYLSNYSEIHRAYPARQAHARRLMAECEERLKAEPPKK